MVLNASLLNTRYYMEGSRVRREILQKSCTLPYTLV